MSKETSNSSFNERPSMSGNSGMLGLSNLKPRLQPVRIKALLENYTSDEEDSEDRGKDSSESEDEDVEPLPDDEEKKPLELCLTRINEHIESTASMTFCSSSKNDPPRETSGRKKNETLRNLEQNFCRLSPAKNKSATIFSDEPESLPRANRRSNVELENPQVSENPATSGKSDPRHFFSDDSRPVGSKDSAGRVAGRNSAAPVYSGYGGQAVSRSESKTIISPEKHKAAAIFSESTTDLALEELKSCSRVNRRSNVELENPRVSENPTNSGKSDSRHFFSDESRPVGSKDSAGRVPGRNSAAPVYSGYGGQAVSRSESKTMIPEGQSGNSRFDRAESTARSQAPVSKAESMFPGQETAPGDKKVESAYGGKERHHSAPEMYSSEVSGQSSSHVIDTPMKNNPPAGSMRPTPSTSHRSIFQTPRNSKAHQDYAQNHVQTPATILSNWAQTHMVQTPLRSGETRGEPVQRARSSSILSQALASHERPLYGKIDERRGRRPLAETSGSSRGNNRLCEKEKASLGYAREILSCSKSFESHRGVCERENENRQKECAARETKENRRPSGSEKACHVEESSVRGSEMIKETISAYPGQGHSENQGESRVSNGPTYDPHLPSFPVANIAPPAPQTVCEKKEIPERQNNVQISVPGRTRRANPGQTITVKDKEYLILGSLGEGMSGQVLRVQELGTLGLRAIKVVDLSRLDKDCSQGCLEEITMLVKLQGPSIVKMFDHEINYPMVHVVMEMGDTDLRSLLNATSAQKRLPLTMILYYWTEMLSAVKHIHDHGVIHSDLKPANFLLVRGRLKLIDFGISSSINSDMTSVFRNNPVGTLNYISPEALMDISGNNEDSPTRNVKYKISFKSDVWSLGCILYSLVYGFTPFHHIRPQWVKINAITNPKPNISFAPPTGPDVEPTPPVLIDVMRKCLQHDPKARPTVGQLLQIPYIPIKPASPKPVRKILPNILMKIKYALTESEWRLFTEVLEDGGNQ